MRKVVCIITLILGFVSVAHTQSNELEHASKLQYPFITEWNTGNSTSITIPTSTGYYDYTVYWEEKGDSVNNGTLTHQTGNATISPLKPNTDYRVEIEGDFPAIYFNNSGDKDKIRWITQWGDIAWKSFNYAFEGCSLLDVGAADTPDLSQVHSLNSMFRGCTQLKGSLANWGWDTKEVYYMGSMFENASSFNQDIGGWETWEVNDMGSMFENASSFNQDISGWHTATVHDMRSMFENAKSFNQDIGGWKIWQANDINNMFNNSGMDCNNYGSTLIGWANNPSTPNNLSLSSLGIWYSSVAVNARNILLGKGWDITDAGEDSYCGTRPFITEWNTGNSTSITIPTSGGSFDYTIYWEEIANPVNNGTLTHQTGSVTILSLKPETDYRIEIKGNFPSINFNDDGDKDKIRWITQWGDIAWKSFRNAFWGCSSLDISTTDTPDLSQVASLVYMFGDCSQLEGKQANWGWNTENITDMTSMFSNAVVFNQDIGGWNTENVIRMNNMFFWALSFNQDIGNWNTGKVTNMSSMFNSARAFNQDIGNWDIRNVSNMTLMLRSSGMDCDNYGFTLTGWADNPDVPDGLTLSAEGCKYGSWATNAKSTLIDNKGWVITDAGEDDSCEMPVFKVVAQAGNTVFNKGESTQLNAVLSFKVSDATYSWSPTSDIDNPNIANPLITPNQFITDYTVTVTSPTYGVVSDTIRIYAVTTHIKICKNCFGH